MALGRIALVSIKGIVGEVEKEILGVMSISLEKAKEDGLLELKAYGGTEQRNLPEGYTQQQYIYMTDNSYLVPNIIPEVDWHIEMDFQTTTITSGVRTYFGGRYDNSAAGAGLRFAHTSSKKVVLYGFDTNNAYTGTSYNMANDTRYKYVYNNNSASLSTGGTVVDTTTFTPNDTTTSEVGINSYRNQNGSFSSVNEDIYLYSFKAWNGQGELVMDLIPVKTSTEVGFYDMVSKTFNTATAGTFTAGGDTVPTPSAPMDIVSNNGVLKAMHQSGLPLGYKLVDYIKATALIELDKPTNDTMEFVAKFYREGSNAQYIYQSDTTSSGTTNTTAYVSSGGNWRFGRRTASINVDTEVMITSVQNVNGVWLNGEQVGTYESMPAFTSTNNLRLFGTQASPTLRLYGLKVYQNGAPFYDLIPCQRESDNAYGVYDLVNGKFFTNSEATITIGSFVSDPVVAKGTSPIETIADAGYYGNLIDLNALTSGYYYNASGVLTSSSNVYLTDWVRVYNGDTITVYTKKAPDANAPVIRMNIFDIQKNWVSQSTMTLDNQDEDVAVINITADGYLRISGAGTLVDWDTAQIIRGSYTVATMPAYKAYVPYHTATCEDLLSINDDTDVQEILSGDITRKVGIKVFNGSENFSIINNTFRYSLTGLSMNTKMICSHFDGDVSPSVTTSNQPDLTLKNNANNNNNAYFKYTAKTTVDSFQQWLKDQYDAGTPVIVVYKLTEETTETVAGQTMTIPAGDSDITITQAGLNTLELSAKYKALP